MSFSRFRSGFSISHQHAQGFTLLEMIVVLVIIGLIMGLVGPRLFAQADKAKVQTAETQVKMLKGALETMRLDTGRFPTQDEGLKLLVQLVDGRDFFGSVHREALLVSVRVRPLRGTQPDRP